VYATTAESAVRPSTPGGNAVSVPEVATGTEAAGPQSFETRSLDRSVDHTRRRAALFRCYPDRVAVLHHVRTTTVDRGPTAAGCEIDTEARLVDVPDDVLGELRADGFDVVAGRTV
jgi:hypothetical protein